MSSLIVDARGQACPKPLILMKKSLKDTEIPGNFTLLTDRENPKNNIQQFLTDNKIEFRTEKKSDCYYIHIDKP
jgi:TusA-related sulfurtransferase